MEDSVFTGYATLFTPGVFISSKKQNLHSADTLSKTLGRKKNPVGLEKQGVILDGAQVANCCISTHKAKLLFLAVPDSQELLKPKQKWQVPHYNPVYNKTQRISPSGLSRKQGFALFFKPPWTIFEFSEQIPLMHHNGSPTSDSTSFPLISRLNATLNKHLSSLVWKQEVRE